LHLRGLLKNLSPFRLAVDLTCACDQDHWSMYNDMDVMLDSWPYCGTITSVECLMMGVPIVTLQVLSSLEARRISQRAGPGVTVCPCALSSSLS
jgi:hypothetical protein